MSTPIETIAGAKAAGAACPQPCNACPWLDVLHGTRHPDGWYTARNRARLWAGLRAGESMSCHKTDPNNPVPEGQQPVAEGTTTHECTGGLILQQREFTKLQHYVVEAEAAGTKDAMRRYRRVHPRGLTEIGALAMMERLAFGPLSTRVKMSRPDMNAPVSHPPLGSWDEWLAAHPPAEARS